MSGPSAAALAAEAVSVFERAVAANDSELAARALELVGRAALARPPAPLSGATVTAFGAHVRLVARAAGLLGTLAELDGEAALPWLLYARSGYQSLLDAGAWPSPPLDAFHLADSDEELVGLARRVGTPAAPPGTPVTHTWWPRASRP